MIIAAFFAVDCLLNVIAIAQGRYDRAPFMLVYIAIVTLLLVGVLRRHAKLLIPVMVLMVILSIGVIVFAVMLLAGSAYAVNALHESMVSIGQGNFQRNAQRNPCSRRTG